MTQGKPTHRTTYIKQTRTETVSVLSSCPINQNRMKSVKTYTETDSLGWQTVVQHLTSSTHWGGTDRTTSASSTTTTFEQVREFFSRWTHPGRLPGRIRKS